MSIEELIQKAKAEPCQSPRNVSRLEPYKQAIKILHREKGFTLKAIAEWLIKHTDISISRGTVYQYLINSKMYKARKRS